MSCQMKSHQRVEMLLFPLGRAIATQGLELAEAAANDGYIATALECMGAVCLELGEAPEAAEYYARAMQQVDDTN